MTKRKILILDDDIEFLKRVKKNIKKFDVVTVSTISKAIKEILKGEILFIVADVKLKGSSEGNTIFRKLFFKGIAIPGILITGYKLPENDKNYFSTLGVLDILEKGRGKGPLSARIEQSANNILKQRNSKFVSIKKNIESYSLQDKNMTFNGVTKKINYYLKIMQKSSTPEEKKQKILKEIINASNRYLKHENNSDYLFDQIQ